MVFDLPCCGLGAFAFRSGLRQWHAHAPTARPQSQNERKHPSARVHEHQGSQDATTSYNLRCARWRRCAALHPTCGRGATAREAARVGELSSPLVSTVRLRLSRTDGAQGDGWPKRACRRGRLGRRKKADSLPDYQTRALPDFHDIAAVALTFRSAVCILPACHARSWTLPPLGGGWSRQESKNDKRTWPQFSGAASSRQAGQH